MRKTGFYAIFGLAASVLIYTSCKKFELKQADNGLVPNLPSTSYDYMTVSLASGEDMPLLNLFNRNSGFFPDPFFAPSGAGEKLDKINNESVTLGRVLFYDTRMSINNSVACATCHDQSKAFSDGVSGSVGFGGKLTGRNSMSIVNPITMNNLFWDSRSSSPFDLALRPVFNHIEMGMESDEMLVKKIQEASFYPNLFQKAFGSSEINKEKIATAVSHFLNSMVTLKSEFDYKILNNGFNPMEALGMDLFFSERLNCGSCHNGQNFSAPDAPGGSYSAPTVKGTANIGLDIVYKDNGKANGKFRIPSLRNVALTAPYMHDGRFKTLEEVVEHYNSGIKSHPNLDDNLKSNGLPKRMNLSNTEKQALIAFLNTLTDKSFTTDVKYSNPFRN